MPHGVSRKRRKQGYWREGDGEALRRGRAGQAGVQPGHPSAPSFAELTDRRQQEVLRSWHQPGGPWRTSEAQ